jgi:predicted alpha/beta superfamily hydrolase
MIITQSHFSQAEGVGRTIRIWLPDDYSFKNYRYGVVYLHDGQNVFDPPDCTIMPSWGINRCLSDLARRMETEAWMVVAIDHRGVDRLSDYAVCDEPSAGVVGRGRLYLKFLVEELKPRIDDSFRTRRDRRNTAIGGSSLGGLISLYGGLLYGSNFGRVCAFSPSVMWSESAIFEDFLRVGTDAPRIYLDAGADESFEARNVRMDYGRRVRDFHSHLLRLGYSKDQLRLVLEAGGNHHEVDWGRRFPNAMEWVLSD